MMPGRRHPRLNRRSIRLAGYDYAGPGAYFVTLNVKGDCVFGEVVGGEMRLNRYGRIVASTWRWLDDHFPGVHVDASVVMPDHVHAIIVISERTDGGTRPLTLGRLVGAFKSHAASEINRVRNRPNARVWQRNYYESIVRSHAGLQRVRRYIALNPARWPRRAHIPTQSRPNHPPP